MTTMTAMRGTRAARTFDHLVAEATREQLGRFIVLARRVLSRNPNAATADALRVVHAELRRRTAV